MRRRKDSVGFVLILWMSILTLIPHNSPHVLKSILFKFLEERNDEKESIGNGCPGLGAVMLRKRR